MEQPEKQQEEPLSGDFDGLYRIERPPSLDPSRQCGGIDTVFPELLRHTDAGCIGGSTTVGDHLPARRTVTGPFNGPVRQHTYGTGDPGPVVVVAGPGPHIHDQWRVRL